ncbi:hypothetical protein KJZ63_01615 [Patescibacteria group bacterium]|nr:hypothetical protein [Patescibacteria group bacterium]
MLANQLQLNKEFDRQVENLLQKGYPGLASLNNDDFLNIVKPLKKSLENLTFVLPQIDLDKGTLPFVIVIKSDLIPSENMMELVEKNGRNGVTILRPHSSINFKTIDEVGLPNSNAYLLIDIDRGQENINLPPSEAMKLIKNASRSPLTVDEGIAIVTQFPDFLIKNNCFSLLASRTGSDQRVPAIWINAKKEPNLGWCWDGNPHTWLGSASCKQRLG